MQIVVIDDERNSLLLFSSHIIDSVDVSLQMFQNNHKAALKFIETHDVYAVFLDIVMPENNGIDLAEKIIKIKPSIKIVFITGYFQNIEEIKLRMKDNFFAFCYKPYDEEIMNNILVRLLEESKPKVYFKTFSHFDCYVNNVLIDFNRAKAKELLALLVYSRGAEVSMEEAITKLWQDKDPRYSKKLYRDAICRLRLTLKKYNIEHLLNVRRARLSLNVNDCTCDYYDYLNGDTSLFHGEFLRPYEWSFYGENYLLNQQKE